MAVPAKTLSYAVSIDREWTATTERGGSPIPAEPGWTPEHHVLLGLGRCILTSLRYHARRGGIELRGSAEARGEVSQRATDGRYAFLHLKVDLDVQLEPPPASIPELVAKAERDCFIGASLTAKPRYHWTVNGEELL